MREEEEKKSSSCQPGPVLYLRASAGSLQLGMSPGKRPHVTHYMQ